mgnify:FL=1
MSELNKYLIRLADGLIASAPKFEELDSAAGDGDLGITAGKIAEGIRSGISTASGDPKSDLMLIGREISKSAPSTFGTLFATGFVRAASAVINNDDPKVNLERALTAAYEGIAARGKAQLGERTLLDALAPAIEALKNSTDLKSGLKNAAIAARRGATETANMAPKHGRAGWIGDRAKGHEDAGANVVAASLEAIC